MTVAPSFTVKVTDPWLTVPAPEVTVAVSATVWSVLLNVAVLSAAVVVVPALLTVSVVVLSELAAKVPVGPLVYAASIVYVFAGQPPGDLAVALELPPAALAYAVLPMTGALSFTVQVTEP